MRKELLKGLILIVLSSGLLTSCGAIFGGSQYYAHVTVDNNPNAQIYYQDELQGTGTATLMLKRKEADKVAFTVKDEKGQQQIFEYRSREFRGWALAGNFVIGFYGLIGMGVDFAAGTLWKPNAEENGIIKEDYKNYQYHLEFGKPGTIPETPIDNLVYDDVVYTRDGSIHRGAIVEKKPNDYVKLKIKDKGIVIIKYSEIEKIIKRTDPMNYQYLPKYGKPATNPEIPVDNLVYDDVVYTRDGSILTGAIVERAPNDYVKLKIQNKGIVIIKYSEIDKIIKSKKLPSDKL